MWTIEAARNPDLGIWPLCQLLKSRLGSGYRVEMQTSPVFNPSRLLQQSFNLASSYDRTVIAVTRFAVLRASVELEEAADRTVLRVWAGYPFNTVAGVLLFILFPLRWLLNFLSLPVVRAVAGALAPQEWTPETEQALALLTAGGKERPRSYSGVAAIRRGYRSGPLRVIVGSVLRLLVGGLLAVWGGFLAMKEWHYAWEAVGNESLIRLCESALALGVGLRWLYNGAVALVGRQPRPLVGWSLLLGGAVVGSLLLGQVAGGVYWRIQEAQRWETWRGKRSGSSELYSYLAVPRAFHRIEYFLPYIESGQGVYESTLEDLRKELERYHPGNPAAEEIRRRLDKLLRK